MVSESRGGCRPNPLQVKMKNFIKKFYTCKHWKVRLYIIFWGGGWAGLWRRRARGENGVGK